MKRANGRGIVTELCKLLWSSTSEIAGMLSFGLCPSLVFPSGDLPGTPGQATSAARPPSRTRSAFLTQSFWTAMFSHNDNDVIAMLAPSICYYTGNGEGLCGKDVVSQKLPYIGFPQTSHLSDPVYWHCDTTTCIAPVKAWAEDQKYCQTTFDGAGLVSEVIIPLDLWR